MKAASAFDRSDPGNPDAEVPAAQKAVIHLYFSDKENAYLIAEERALLLPDGPAEAGRVIFENLVQGPRGGLMRTVPSGTALRALYVSEDGTAYVDASAVLRDAHPGGVQSEMMSIFSIVNSLVLNVSEIETVKILIDGQESTTLAGHVDLRFPFKADMLLIR